MPTPYEFNNRYLCMRHGESVANREEIIVSSAETGCVKYGLTGKGVGDVSEVALGTYLDSRVKVFCSDFLRTKQTAEVITNVLDASAPIETELLRERFFGSWEGSSSENYERVWQDDELDIYQNNVESVHDVLLRSMQFLWQLEQQHSGELILLVSHGDCLQILMAWCQGLSPCLHRSLHPVKPAQVRKLKLTRSFLEIQHLLDSGRDQAA